MVVATRIMCIYDPQYLHAYNVFLCLRLPEIKQKLAQV